MTVTSEVPQAPHRVAIFSVVAMALLMSSLDGTIVATALHAIEHGLHSTINWTSWVITAYSVGKVFALSLAGKLSDRSGGDGSSSSRWWSSPAPRCAAVLRATSTC